MKEWNFKTFFIRMQGFKGMYSYKLVNSMIY